MYSKTRFREVLKGLPRGVFERFVGDAKADKYNKGFRSWNQLIAMVYSHLSGCKNLRELEVSFNAQTHHHYHSGSRSLKMELSAEDVAPLYKKRWDIELYFKCIKQNLKLKSFLGRSEYTVRIQIYTALISYFLLQAYQHNTGRTMSLKLCLSSLRVSLFQPVETEHCIARKAQRWRRTLDQIQADLTF